jgi:phosphohistidine phosphatase
MRRKRELRDELLLLVRHAKAEDANDLGDASRALTMEGREAFRAHAEALARRCSLHGIVTSPLVRAVQTAEILAESFKVSDVIVRAELAPGRGSPAAIVQLADEYGTGWALVGHNPTLAEAAAALAGRGDGDLRLRKGSVAAYLLKKGEPHLEWLWAPGREIHAEIQ